LNLYSNKQKWKIVLLAFAMMIILASLWYSSTIVSQQRQKESESVELWRKGFEQKAKLVMTKNSFFQSLKEDEFKKVDLWKEAIEYVTTADDEADLSLPRKIIANNTTVPILLTDQQKTILTYRNIDTAITNYPDKLKELREEMEGIYPPIEITFDQNRKQFLFYKNSKVYTGLEQTINDLIQSFISEVVLNSAAVPVILTNTKQDSVISFGNIDSAEIDSKDKLISRLAQMRVTNKPLDFKLFEEEKGSYFIFYEDSPTLRKLKYFPVIQIGIMGLFLFVSYLIFSTFRKAEQNQVWVGMAKETAHQLGTPLSSLMAWLEILKEKNVDTAILSEIKKDINRLETVTDRFSKIGSEPELKEEKLFTVIDILATYLRTRLSSKVDLTIKKPDHSIKVKMSKPLFEWVVENLIKNAVDAMKGKGKVTVDIFEENEFVIIDITDTGHGIPGSKLKTVFEPGYTTKKRGWGLGLSLTKRIIENYHNGKIFVKRSEIDKGTTFRIELNK